MSNHVHLTAMPHRSDSLPALLEVPSDYTIQSETASRKKVLPLDPVQSAIIAGLRYVNGNSAGIVRKRVGREFYFFDSNGRRIRWKTDLERIKSLAIPPAWKRVWICPSPNGHLQAVGYDARGRKQFRYHPLYRQVRNHTKFSRMPDFGKALPAIRKRVKADLSRPGLPRRKVLATVVELLETTCMRIGNGRVHFRFRGKSGLVHEVEVHGRRLAKIVKQCQDLPGYELFQYLEGDAEPSTVDSSDVNQYLREIAGRDFTAKDFRTWAGTVECAMALAEIGPFSSETEAKGNIVAAIKTTAERLGNRPATCRNYYVHPAILDAYADGTLLPAMRHAAQHGNGNGGLRPEELRVMAIIQKRQETAQNLDFLSGAA
jgi:DNA topoisomerase-1